ncbi:hypothetical protein T12_10807 [Trichinella patagoniensis]|uniref:Uncharacterized protein n=1 Tax=Trichinella patagoniensis TaxID=990121 RepID=A0A0V0ZBR3_9BILA|nr:hypothetical protein T09_12679 [Trichinella sp. T9]KRY09763.1 hypothetical protein T12_10807 [Trichinella patagoniensis]
MNDTVDQLFKFVREPLTMTVVMWKIASRLKRQNTSRRWKQSFHQRILRVFSVNRRKRGTRSREQQRCPSRECPKLKCQRVGDNPGAFHQPWSKFFQLLPLDIVVGFGRCLKFQYAYQGKNSKQFPYGKMMEK